MRQVVCFTAVYCKQGQPACRGRRVAVIGQKVLPRGENDMLWNVQHFGDGSDHLRMALSMQGEETPDHLRQRRLILAAA